MDHDYANAWEIILWPFIKLIELTRQIKGNKTGLQPVSRPVEQILGFFQKGLKNYQKGIIIIKGAKMVQIYVS